MPKHVNKIITTIPTKNGKNIRFFTRVAAMRVKDLSEKWKRRTLYCVETRISNKKCTSKAKTSPYAQACVRRGAYKQRGQEKRKHPKWIKMHRHELHASEKFLMLTKFKIQNSFT